MKKLITSILAITTSAFLATAADGDKPADAKPAEPAADAGKKGAGKKPHASPEEMFKKMDANNDGSVSLEEFKTVGIGKKDPAKGEEIFKKRDKDSDGKITKEEFAPARKGKKKNQ